MSAFGLAKQLGIPAPRRGTTPGSRAERCGCAGYMERTRQQADAQGYVETLFGRRLYLPDIRSRNAGLRKAAHGRPSTPHARRPPTSSSVPRSSVAGWIRGLKVVDPAC